MKINSWPRTDIIPVSNNVTQQSEFAGIFSTDPNAVSTKTISIPPMSEFMRGTFKDYGVPEEFNCQLHIYWNSSMEQGHFPIDEDGYRINGTETIILEDTEVNRILEIKAAYVNFYDYGFTDESWKEAPESVDDISFVRNGNVLTLDTSHLSKEKIIRIHFLLITEDNNANVEIRQVKLLREIKKEEIDLEDVSMTVLGPFHKDGWKHEDSDFLLVPGASDDEPEVIENIFTRYKSKYISAIPLTLKPTPDVNGNITRSLMLGFWGRNRASIDSTHYLECTWNTKKGEGRAIPRYDSSFYMLDLDKVFLRDDNFNRITRIIALSYDRYAYNRYGYGLNEMHITEVEFVRDGDLLILDVSKITKHRGHRIIFSFETENPESNLSIYQITYVTIDEHLKLAHADASLDPIEVYE